MRHSLLPARWIDRLLLGLCLLLLPIFTHAETSIDSAHDRIHPVLAQRGMVVSQEALASQIGLDILKQGGNAVDAAIAIGFALAVTLPQAGNLGGGRLRAGLQCGQATN